MYAALNNSLRSKLEKTVKEACFVAESAAKAALEQLGFGETAPVSHLSENDRELRRRLRAHGRQSGDFRNAATELQQINRLIEEVAYEHWHRMLFARFLAENDLLMYPDPVEPVAVSLEECVELAADEGAANGWELASRFAAKMLPQIFKPDSPVFGLTLPPEFQQRLERLVTELPVEVFTASDSLGWVYQFWQAKKKDEVNASEVKIGARELPAVTQLFTEPYMVSFLLDNSLGAWWAARRLSETDLQNAASEEELRAQAAIPGVSLEYLRFVKTEDGAWTPAAGTFDGWSERLSELKTLDPCCGSGHFLVAAFLMLVPMRIELEKISAREAVDSVLRENIHGLEIDRRCVELAAFALALTAWRYPKAGGYRRLPELNVACSGLAIGARREEWLAPAGDNVNLRTALEELYKQFKDAPLLGSLIDPRLSLGTGSLFESHWEEVGPLLTKALSGEKNDEKNEIGVSAKGISKAAELLAGRYELVLTNVPYLGRGKQTRFLFDFLEQYFPISKWDLATSFIERCLKLTASSGIACVVSPQNWYFSARYKAFRENLLASCEIKGCCRLGSGAFSSISGEVVKAGLTIISVDRNGDELFLVDANDEQGSENKAGLISRSPVMMTTSEAVANTADSRFIFSEHVNTGILLEKAATCYQGLVTGDSNRFLASFWEIIPNEDWVPFVNARKGANYGFNNYLLWEEGKGSLHAYARETRDRLHDMHESGNLAWKNKGIAVGRVTRQIAPYFGHHFDNSVAVITPKDDSDLVSVYEFACSADFQHQLQLLDQKLSLTNATILKVHYDAEKWTNVSAFPAFYSDDPTQWIFHGHPAHSTEPLQTAVARLLGYRFPAELDRGMELSDEARALVEKSAALLPYADRDGIVCIPAVRGEMRAEERLENLLAAAYGDDWSPGKKAELLAGVDHAGKTLENWLRDKFFTQHFKLFRHRPFIWHIWDGLNDGFAALVNCHRLDARLLDSLIYNYLGDWITRRKQDIADGVDGARERLAAAERLKKRLELIKEGEAPYDIFVRWKPLEEQPVGWNPDLNDGVRLNIRPFLSVPDVGKRGAGVLRDKPNVNWNKDRGKDVESAPWYELGLKYGGGKGDRINDHHLSLEEKRKTAE